MVPKEPLTAKEVGKFEQLRLAYLREKNSAEAENIKQQLFTIIRRMNSETWTSLADKYTDSLCRTLYKTGKIADAIYVATFIQTDHQRLKLHAFLLRQRPKEHLPVGAIRRSGVDGAAMELVKVPSHPPPIIPSSTTPIKKLRDWAQKKSEAINRSLRKPWIR